MSHVPDFADSAHGRADRWSAAMLDHPEKTTRLLSALKAAMPFEIELTPPALDLLRAQTAMADIKPKQVVSNVSYAGDEGGIVCYLYPDESANAVVISLTHLRLRPSSSVAAGVLAYQKHRTKKLKKLGEL
ncbi:MAG: hypothetical protein KDJ30_05670 [Rhodoblastus sp.]|nr:hypothetical protein [Rhodoblastus sp.]